MLGSSLLSHGETPHYHRRYGVSLLSSAWGQVGPPRYRRQANSVCQTKPRKSGADTQNRTGDLTLTKGALYRLSHISTLNLMPGSSLLSHGETPHYHRRYGVSLLSSAWGQVGPPRYRRQANSVLPTAIQAIGSNLEQAKFVSLKHLRCCKVKPHGSLVLVSSTYRYAYTPSLSTS